METVLVGILCAVIGGVLGFLIGNRSFKKRLASLQNELGSLQQEHSVLAGRSEEQLRGKNELLSQNEKTGKDLIN